MFKEEFILTDSLSILPPFVAVGLQIDEMTIESI